jgi:hypothetical protein
VNTDTIERVQEVEFFNVKDPGASILVSQDPDTLTPGKVNPVFGKDKYATFRAGLFSTSDPEIIEALNSPKFRAKGVRCKDNPEDMAEYGSAEDRKSFMEREIERQVAERLEEERAARVHAEASPFQVSPAQAVESVAPGEE